jgi:hypothetical protein
MIEMRRMLIDRLSSILPQSELFRGNAFYPRRYYDDLMIAEKGFREHLNSIKSRRDFEVSQIKKFALIDASMHDESQATQGPQFSPKSSVREIVAFDPTRHQSVAKITSKLAFGVGTKNTLDSHKALVDVNPIEGDKSRNHSRTIVNDSRDNSKAIFPSIKKIRDHSQEEGTFIKRNMSMQVMNKIGHTPRLFNSTRKNGDKQMTAINTEVQPFNISTLISPDAVRA